LFLIVPFVGYTRLVETVVITSILGVLLLSLAYGSTRKPLGGMVVVTLLAVAGGGFYNSEYLKYLLRSIDASVIYDESLRQGRRFYAEDGKGGVGRIRPASVKVLEEDETIKIRDHVLSKKDSFMHIDHLAYALPFFTYGPYWGYHEFGDKFNHNIQKARPTHEHMHSSTFTTYDSAVALTRDEMKAELGWFYDKVFGGLREVLGAEDIEFLPGKVGIPGFHIIPSHVAWSLPVFRFHSDEVGFDEEQRTEGWSEGRTGQTGARQQQHTAHHYN